MNRLAIRVPAPFERVVALTTEALREQGFGVLTKIDIRETLLAGLGVRVGQYLVLGACDPAFAKRVLDIDRRAGLMLPCHLVVREDDEMVTVEVMDPTALAAVLDNPDLTSVAADARRRLGDALAAVYSVAR